MRRPGEASAAPEHLPASAGGFEAYGGLSAYTLALGAPAFPHQHIVDAYGAQHAGGPARPIRTAYSLIGLYLACEQGVTGRWVQAAHLRLARVRLSWPAFVAPRAPAWLTVAHPLAAPAGPERDIAIRAWGDSVWQAWHPMHAWAGACGRERLG